jgi:hypothetical protein
MKDIGIGTSLGLTWQRAAVSFELEHAYRKNRKERLTVALLSKRMSGSDSPMDLKINTEWGQPKVSLYVEFGVHRKTVIGTSFGQQGKYRLYVFDLVEIKSMKVPPKLCPVNGKVVLSIIASDNSEFTKAL